MEVVEIWERAALRSTAKLGVQRDELRWGSESWDLGLGWDPHCPMIRLHWEAVLPQGKETS